MFKKIRYFHVTYVYVINDKERFNSTPVFSKGHFNEQTLIENIKNTLISRVVITNIYEFKNKQDYDAYYKTQYDG